MKLRSMLSALVVMGSVVAFAGDEAAPYTAKLTLVQPQGNLKQITNGGIGYGVELAMDFAQGEDFGFQAHADYFVVRGKESGSKEPFDAKALFLGVDARYKTRFGTVFSGPVLASWDVTGKSPNNGGTGALGETSWKLGWRAGYDYAFNKTWSVGISYTQTEYRVTQGAVSDRLSPLNPSFVKVGVGYSF